MSSHTVMVWGQPQEVQTDRISKAVWRATGTYMGETHQTQDRTENTAIKRWQEWAKYKGN